ncbi:MAG: hypothetical protein IT458_19740 [Planctomycetes bacterium]|nr:hypothetical protein [Planctomycetota bacterium]
MTAPEEFTRSPGRLARLLNVARSTIDTWRDLGLPWSEPLGWNVAACRRWAQERREQREARQAGQDLRSLAELRRSRARLARHRHEVTRSKLLPAGWCREQMRNRSAEVGKVLLALVPALAARIAGQHARTARATIEDTLRAACEDLADRAAEIPLPMPASVMADLEREPAVRDGERPAEAARRWLDACRLADAAAAELALERERGELMPTRWFDTVLADRAQGARRALEALARAVAPSCPRMNEGQAADLLHEELHEILVFYSRPLPRPPEPTDAETRAEDLGDDLRELEHDDVRDSEDNPNTETDR